MLATRNASLLKLKFVTLLIIQNYEKKITTESEGKKITSASKNQAFTTAGGWSVNNHQYADFAPVMLPVPNIEGCSNQR